MRSLLLAVIVVVERVSCTARLAQEISSELKSGGVQRTPSIPKRRVVPDLLMTGGSPQTSHTDVAISTLGWSAGWICRALEIGSSELRGRIARA